MALSSLRHFETSINGLEDDFHLDFSSLTNGFMFLSVEEHFYIFLEHRFVQQLLACGPLFGVNLQT